MSIKHKLVAKVVAVAVCSVTRRIAAVRRSVRSQKDCGGGGLLARLHAKKNDCCGAPAPACCPAPNQLAAQLQLLLAKHQPTPSCGCSAPVESSCGGCSAPVESSCGGGCGAPVSTGCSSCGGGTVVSGGCSNCSSTMDAGAISVESSSPSSAPVISAPAAPAAGAAPAAPAAPATPEPPKA